MRILVVAENPGIHAYLLSLDGAGAHHIVQYNHPLKAFDNLPEIDPHMVLWSYDDFPRHWKICLSHISDKKPPVVFYLMSETQIPQEESAKAEALGVEAIFAQGFFAEDVHDLFASIAEPSGTRATGNESPTGPSRLIPETTGDLSFADGLSMLSPKTAVITVATILSVNSREIVVELKNKSRVSEFGNGTIIEHATLFGQGVKHRAVLRVAEKPVADKLRLSIVELN